MFTYLKESFKRKIARRVFKEYPTVVNSFKIDATTEVKFANWKNPLVVQKSIDSSAVNFFKKFITDGDLVIDIGANIGHMTITMSLANGRSGLTLAFDPNPYVLKILTQNCELNKELTNIIPLPFAITETEEEFYYNSSEASFNNGGISKEKDSRHGKYALKEKIKGIVLEKYLNQNYPERLGRLSLIKIDTEGYDKQIIKSISNLLVKYHPVIISECFKKLTPKERSEHFEMLSSMGYELFYFDSWSDNAEIIPIKGPADMMRWKHFDFFATPRVGRQK